MGAATTILATPWAEFLQSTPPDTPTEISDLGVRRNSPGGFTWRLNSEDVQLFCNSEPCQGLRFFECLIGLDEYFDDNKFKNLFLTYICRNCQSSAKVYAVSVKRHAGKTDGSASKYGESPPFGPHVPARVISLIGPDRDLFLKGRRSENRGLGIGAFSYYRRVVENQKSRIIEEIARVAKKLGAKAEVLAEFEAAAKETQFTTAIERMKQGIPPVLLIAGQHNPLTLLHSALSEGLHEHTDEECLEIAQDIRVVLTELAERSAEALKQEAELTDSVTRLLTRKAKSVPKN
jgi:hypothetical protein